MSQHLTDEELYLLMEDNPPLSPAKHIHLERCGRCREALRRVGKTERLLRGLQPLRAPEHLPETIVRLSAARKPHRREKTPFLFLSLILLGAASAWGAGLFFSKWFSGTGLIPPVPTEKLIHFADLPAGLVYYMGLGLCSITLYLLFDIHKKYKSRPAP